MLNELRARERSLNLVMYIRFCLLLFLLFPVLVNAQETYMTGNVFDNDTRATVLQGVSVKNLTTKSFAVTDKDGHYAIVAKKGDLLSYTMVGYAIDTVYLTSLFPKNIYLRVAVNNLQPVNIVTTKMSPYLDLKDREAVAARSVDYSKDRGGLRLNLGYGKMRRQQAKVNELEEEYDFIEEINKNFNQQVVQKMVNYQGKDLVDYLDLYRPTVSQIKADRPFNYTYYIATTFSEWTKLPADAKKLPKLLKLKLN